MSNNDEYKKFFNGYETDEDKKVVEVPAEERPPYVEKLSSGYDPMGEIYLRGRAMRNMSSGQMPWIVIISGWILFGGTYLLILGAAIASKSFILSLMIFPAVIPLWIMLRGTMAKLSAKKHRGI
ncbi:hypothetical protein NIES4071_81140 [Calothrix sp. NIES-4071]|nr:hypothetical protein NIES4071_81140 [Calothrix sp. NIES-4071]BAZ62384.1 hypothetical protein NIES4105_81070 [Calothrix sp. NIES-4105]